MGGGCEADTAAFDMLGDDAGVTVRARRSRRKGG